VREHEVEEELLLGVEVGTDFRIRVFLSDAIDASDARIDFMRVFGVAPYWSIDAQRRFERRSFVAVVAPNVAMRRGSMRVRLQSS
jgi:hypothetical protein